MNDSGSSDNLKDISWVFILKWDAGKSHRDNLRNPQGKKEDKCHPEFLQCQLSDF